MSGISSTAKCFHEKMAFKMNKFLLLKLNNFYVAFLLLFI